jgi:two-component system CheB/CheR fusion protein
MTAAARETVPARVGAAADPLRFPVVGIGASAGGVAALRRFLANVPPDSGMAFVVLLEAAQAHEGALEDLLQESTALPVRRVEGPTPLAADMVYLVPPPHGLSIVEGRLRPAEPVRTEGRSVAVDLFFRTLADACRERAICVVMSGVGDDGTQGLARVKEVGGLTLAQAPADAEFEGMPRSAIASGLVDMVLAAADMPARLAELWSNARRMRLPDPPPDLAVMPTDPKDTALADDALRDIMDWLRARSGHDFAHYKRATVLRRIERRMQVNVVPTLPSYRDLLHRDAEETPALLQDMLVSVTNFFRDRDAFEALARELSLAHARREPHEPVRAWVAGCATGEEAYSVAMLLCDEFSHPPPVPEIQVFASDIDQRAVDLARHGRYGEAIAADVSEQRLRAHFLKDKGGWRIARNVRDKVTFSTHNVLRDPPFTRLDLVCCRNVLIYLERPAQLQVLKTFHFALKPGGLLMLGSTETADAAEGLFEVVDRKQRIYRVVPVARPRGVDLAQAAPATAFLPVTPRVDVTPIEHLHRRLYGRLAAPGVLVDSALNVLHVDHRAAKYLRHVGGVPTNKLLTLVRPELRPALRATLQRALKTRQAVEAPLVCLEGKMGRRFVRAVARPVLSDDSGGPVAHLLVTFDEFEATLSPENGDEASPQDATVRALELEVERLQAELARGTMQSAAASEDLRASNEELQAVNEELRSTTEELETSTEELQSTNEELMTVNEALRAGIDETAKLNDDLRNLLASTDIAIVFLDRGLALRRFTPTAASVFNVIPGDIGRPLRDLNHDLDYPALWDDVANVMRTLQQVEREVRATGGRWFLARLLPYRAGDDRIGGVVLSFIDVTAGREVQERLRASERYARLVAQSMQDYAMFTTDPAGVVTWWAPGAQRLFGYAAGEIVGRGVELLFTPEDRAADVPRREMQAALVAGRAGDERWMVRKDGSVFFCGGVTSRLEDEELAGFARIARDLTQSRLGEAERKARLEAETSARRRLEEASGMKDEFLAVMAHELKNPLHLIRLHTDLLLHSPETRMVPAVQRSAGSIHRAIVTQVKIIDDLLDWSRLKTGKLLLKLEPVDVRAVAERIAVACRADAAAKGAGFAFEASGELVVQGDAVRIEQVVWNLFNNAVKFTSPGGAVKVQARAEDGFAVLVVEDDGDGIDPAFLPCVFEMFQQAARASGYGKGGLGIGLALVKRLVAMHGGEVEARSPGIGLGSTFTVRLPLFDAPPVEEPPGLATRKLGGLRTLLVDEEHDARNALQHLLALAGAEVAGADSAEAAMAAAAQGAFDALVIDIGSPAVGGLSLLGRLRAHPHLAGSRAVAISPRHSEAERAIAASVGFDDFVDKPVDIEQLVEALSRAAARRAAARGRG